MKKKSIFQAILFVLAVIGWAVYDYIALPAYSVHSFRLWIMIAIGCAALVLIFGLFGKPKKAVLAAFIAFAIVAGAALLVSLGDQAWWPGNGKRLSEALVMAERTVADFSDDFARGDGTGGFLIPGIDKEQAAKLAQDKAAELKKGDAYPAAEYASIIHTRMAERDRLLYVAPLDHANGRAALMRGSAGTPGFVEVDLEDGQARIVEVEGGLIYSPGAILAHDLKRHVRMKYRTALLGEFHFEIDDAGKPWWIVEMIETKAGLFGGADLSAVALLNASSGALERYALGEEPEWVDRTISFGLAIKQAKDGLRLANGWANQKFGGKKEVLDLSDGYGSEIFVSASRAGAYLSAGVIDGKARADGIVGILMIDLKAKEAARYAFKGITELRAMDLAGQDERSRGQGLTPSWPTIDAVAGKPAYSMMLRNSSEAKFAYVDAAEGSKIALADSPAAARAMMAGLLGGERTPVAPIPGQPRVEADRLEPALAPPSAVPPAAGVADPGLAGESAIATARFVVLRVKESDGQVQFLAQGDVSTLYAAPVGLSNGSRFLKAGDSVEVKYRASADGRERYVVELKNLSLEP